MEKQTNKVMTRGQARKKELIFYWSILAFPIVQYIIFYIIVNANSFVLAFQKYDSTKGKYFWVGFDNIADQLKDFAQGGLLREAVKGSLLAFGLNTLMIPLEIIFPYYIYKKLPGAGFFKVTLFLPHVLSGMVLALLYKNFANNVIPEFGRMMGKEIPLLMRGDTAFIMAWLYTAIFGFTNVMMYLGAMSNISDSVVEYSRLEGCSLLQEFWYITFPIIFPTVVIYFITTISGIFSNQMALYTFYGKETSHAVTVGYLIFARTFSGGMADYPIQAATGLIFTCIVSPIVVILRHLAKKRNSDVV